MAALDLPCDVASAGSVRKLLFHIFTTELFFANRVLDESKVDYENLPHATLQDLFGLSVTAQEKFQQFLATASHEEWAKPVPLGFRDFKASKRKMMMQVVMHSIHHRAQLATFLRQQGFKQDWTHDFIVSKLME
ncbi:MAG: DinB family protein [Terriglobales bacterium]